MSSKGTPKVDALDVYVQLSQDLQDGSRLAYYESLQMLLPAPLYKHDIEGKEPHVSEPGVLPPEVRGIQETLYSNWTAEMHNMALVDFIHSWTSRTMQALLTDAKKEL